MKEVSFFLVGQGSSTCQCIQSLLLGGKNAASPEEQSGSLLSRGCDISSTLHVRDILHLIPQLTHSSVITIN